MSYTYLHFHSSSHAELFEDFCSQASQLPDDEIYVPPQHQPINPEDEDNIIPAEHAAFGIMEANRKSKPKEWKDLGLEQLMTKGPKVLGEPVKGKGGNLPR